MLTPLHFWTVFFGTGLLLVLLAWLGSRRRRLNPLQVQAATGEVACGHCGYDVRALPSDICPECGSDLNEVGRLAPQFRRWQAVPPLARGLAFAVVVLVMAALLGAMALADHVPFRRRMTSEDVLQARTLVPPGGGTLTFSIAEARDDWWPSEAQRRGSSRMLGPEALERSVVIEAGQGNPQTGLAVPGATLARLEIDRIEGTWRIIRGGAGGEVVAEGAMPMTPEEVLLWLSLAVYADDQRPAVQEIVARASFGGEADPQRREAAALLAAAGGMFGHVDVGHWSAGESLMSRLPEPWVGAVGQQGFLILWGGGPGEVSYMSSTGDSDWRPAWPHALVMAGFWLAVLVASVRFAARRRTIRPGGAVREPEVAAVGSALLE